MTASAAEAEPVSEISEPGSKVTLNKNPSGPRFIKGIGSSGRRTDGEHLDLLLFVHRSGVHGTCGTPMRRHASRKFSTFLRHLAMVSLGCGQTGQSAGHT